MFEDHIERATYQRIPWSMHPSQRANRRAKAVRLFLCVT